MRTVYDIEVFHQLNLAGFLRNGGVPFWVVNANGLEPQEFEFKGGRVYVNLPGAQYKIEYVTRGKKGTPYGFNNHNYDDFLLDDIGAARPCEYVKEKSDAIIKTRPRIFFDWESYDTAEQMPANFSLKKWESMSGATVDESSIPFDYEGTFTLDMLREVLEYNLFDLQATDSLAQYREGYFKGKELLVNEYGYPGARRYSNGSLSARYLMANERLDDYKVPGKPTIEGVPQRAADFLNEALTASPYAARGKTARERAQRKAQATVQVTTEAFGNVFTWGWGGLHSARGHVTYTKTGRERVSFDHLDIRGVQQWDVSSMFPSIIIRDRLLGNATDKFAKLVKERLKNKAAGNPLAATQKIVINAVYGLLRLNGSRLFNPYAAIWVNVSGMVAIYSLAYMLSGYGEIIQTNTDGIAFKPYENTTQAQLDFVRDAWQLKFGLNLEVSTFERLIQRDVNNYIAVYPDGHLKLKGGAVSRADKNDLTKNTSPRIIQKALVKALVDGVPVSETIRTGELADYCFTLSAAKTKMQTGFTLEIPENGIPKRLTNRVNRVVAATNGSALMKEKAKDENGELRNPAAFPDAPLSMTVLNDALWTYDSKQVGIDFGYYEDLAERKVAQWH